MDKEYKCHICGNIVDEDCVCIRCDQHVCDNCTVSYTQFNLCDETRCNDCQARCEEAIYREYELEDLRKKQRIKEKKEAEEKQKQKRKLKKDFDIIL